MIVFLNSSIVMRRTAGPICLQEIGEMVRGRKPCPPTMTSVLTTTTNGIGVSSSACPLAKMANAEQAPIASGRSNAHRLLTMTPATRAIARMRMIVIGAD